MIHRCCSLVFLALLTYGYSTYAADCPIKLGNETVVIHTIKQGEGKVFVHLHQNERTALKAAKAVVAKDNGLVITLQHTGQRNIVFHLAGSRYEFDPNRIFTDTGIKKSLSRFGPYSKAAHKEVRQLADKLKQIIPPGKVIAVHNNRSYSLKDYLPGHSLSFDADAINYHNKHQFRNFFLVTQQKDYQRLKQLKFNSILQSKHAENDGSLSVFLANRDYINVEAGYDQLAAQIKMLQTA